MNCQAVVTSSGTPFTLLGLQSPTGYSMQVADLNKQTLQFNYCTYIDDEEDIFGKIVFKDGSADLAVAEKAIPRVGAENLRDDESNIIGITFAQKSDSLCLAGAEAKDDINWSMRTNLYCDDAVSNAGGAVVNSVTMDAVKCEYLVSMNHSAGCPTTNIDLEEAQAWIDENQWVIGIVYVVAGPLIALFGLKWFPYVTAAIAALFTMVLVTSFSLAMGWM